jgi:hypothetical protein
VGWRAIYLNDPGDDPEFSTQPLVAFAVYEVTSYPVVGNSAPERSLGREILGVVDCGGYLGPPETFSNFWELRGPDQPDPTAEEVAEKRKPLM